MSTARRTRKTSSSGSDISNPSGGSESLSNTPSSDKPTKKRSGESDTASTSSRTRGRHSRASTSEAPSEAPSPKRARPKRKAADMEQPTQDASEKSALSSSSSIPIPSSTSTASPSRKRTKTQETGEEDVADDVESSDDEADQPEVLLFGEDDQMQSDEPTPSDDKPQDEGKPRDEESDRKKLDQLMQKFGSPQDFNPMMHMNSGQWDSILAMLNDDDPSLQLSALMDLHSTLSISNEDTMGSFKFDQFIPSLLRFLQNSLMESEMYETLAIQCFFYLVDSYPPSGSFLIRHGVVPVLCEKLLNIGGSIDVPEQAIKLIALMSEHAASGLHVLRAGGLAGLLAYLDFFGMDIQMKALTAASNIVRHVPKESYQSVIDAMPHLLNVLQSHHDSRIVEKACLAVSRIVESLHGDIPKLRELDPHAISSALIRHMSISSSGATPETASTANLAVRTLATLCRSCPDLVEALLVQSVPEILRALLNLEQEYAKTKAAQASKMFSAQHVYDIMALVSHLLPPLPAEISSLLRSAQGPQPPQSGASAFLRTFGARLGIEEPAPEKAPASPVPPAEQAPSETDPRLVLFLEQPQLLAHLSGSILPSLLRVFGSMVNVAVRYKCLTAIAKLIHHAPPALLSESLKDLTISAFIASLLTSKDANIVCCALYMAETLIEKLPAIFSEYFMREGVVHEVDKLIRDARVPESPALAVGESDPVVGSPAAVSFAATTPSDSAQGASEEVLSTSAPSAALASSPSTPSKSSLAIQMREKVNSMARHFKDKYFCGASSEGSSSEALIILRDLAQRLNEANGPAQATILEDICKILFKGISTFEVLQSGMTEAIVEYIRRGGLAAATTLYSVLAHPIDNQVNGALILVRELQKALDKVERLNVAVNPAGGSGSSGLKYLTYPFKVQLKRAEGESKLKNYGEAVIMVEPLATMGSVKDFLRRRLVLSLSQEHQNSAEPSAQPSEPAASSAEPPATDGAKTDDMIVDEPPQPDNGKGVEPGNEGEDAADDDEAMHDDDDQVEDQMVHDSDDDEDAGSMDRSVHNIEVSEDHSSHGDLQEPTAPAQETQASKVSKGDADVDIQFTLSGHELDDANTVFQIFHANALRKQSLSQSVDGASDAFDQPQLPLTRLWEDVYTIEYCQRPRSINKSSDTVAKADEKLSLSNTRVQSVSSGFATLLQALSDADGSSDFNASLHRAVGADAQTCSILQLLRLLYEINSHASLLSSRPNSHLLIPTREFTNSKLTSKLMRQLQDALMVCAGSLPLWCTFLPSSTSFHFIFPFELRQLLFRSTSLGISRALAALQDQLHEATDIRIGRIPRQKVRISRERMLDSAIKVSQLVRGNRGILEVEYFNEVGTGLGPTLEFYTLVSKEIQRRDLNVWIDSSSSGSWVDAAAGLFPRPTNPATISDETLKHFEFIGTFVAKAMFDNRLLDIPFSSAFLKKILGIPLDLADLEPLLPSITKSLMEFNDLLTQMEKNPEEPILYKKAKLEDLDLYFVFPSDQSWELVPSGSDQALKSTNLREYVNLVTKAVMVDGIQKQFDSFKKGFDSIFPLRCISFFDVDELDSLLCGSLQDHQPWDRQTILENSKFDHGYSASSRAVGYLVEVLTELTPEQRRKFLKFATGSTRLPPRGFKDMNPKLTFVRKEVDAASSPDDYMPSVNTCFGYLKLPEYSSKDVLKKRLLFAIEHGQDAFSFN